MASWNAGHFATFALVIVISLLRLPTAFGKHALSLRSKRGVPTKVNTLAYLHASSQLARKPFYQTSQVNHLLQLPNSHTTLCPFRRSLVDIVRPIRLHTWNTWETDSRSIDWRKISTSAVSITVSVESEFVEKEYFPREGSFLPISTSWIGKPLESIVGWQKVILISCSW